MIAGRLALFFAVSTAAFAHVGSPDVFYEGNAGPYHLLVTVRPPAVIPGVAEVEVRSASPDVKEVRVVPLRLTGPGAKFAPTPDIAKRSPDDPQFYTGSLWMMGFGAWQVRVEADGALGKGELSVPVPALAMRSSTMQKGLGTGLFALLAVLVIGIVSIVGAGVREAQLEPGVATPEKNRKRGAVVMAVTFVLVCLAVYLGGKWWDAEARAYASNIYQPVEMSATVENGGRLVLRLQDKGWFRFDKLDDLVPDHGHLMHLYVISTPAMDRVWHLHPEQTEPATFVMDLPAMPAGRYKLYADIVHSNGIGETGTSEIEIPQVSGAPPGPDDGAGTATPVAQADFARRVAQLPDGYRMVWIRNPAPPQAKRTELFRFRVEDANGKPAEDMELYMGMAGHAAFVRDDFQVFVHVHPSGSAPMAALMMTEDSSGRRSMHSMPTGAPPAEVTFPYGFPQPGNYRIFVQVRRGGQVETGIFDARVE
jgi:hypothetical protein